MPRRFALWLAAGALGLLAGCATWRPVDSRQANEENNALAHDSQPAPSAWWQRLNDPLLSALIGDALQANTSVRSAQAALRQSRALAQVQMAALGPTLGAAASAQRSRSGGVSSNQWRAGLDGNWSLDLMGGQHAAVAAAQADTQAVQASLADVQTGLAAEVALGLSSWRSLQWRLSIAQANLASQLHTLQITQWRTQAGLASTLDVAQAQGAAEQTRALLPALASAATLAEHSLAVLTGRGPDALRLRLQATMSQAVPDALALLRPELQQGVPVDTVRQRADVRAAEWRLTAAWQRVVQAHAARYPSLGLSGTLGLGAATLGALTQGSSVLASALASLAVPLWDGGAAKAQELAQRAALDTARVAYESVVLAALKDAQDSFTQLAGDQQRLQSQRLAADAARTAETLARQRYAHGLVDFQVVLETQRSALATQDNVATTVADLNADLLRLIQALGGGWPAPQATPTGATLP